MLAGAVFFLAGTVGLLRFPDVYTRLHALTKADNVGLVFVVLGLLPQVGSVLAGLKLILVWLLVMLSSAAVSQVPTFLGGALPSIIQSRQALAGSLARSR